MPKSINFEDTHPGILVHVPHDDVVDAYAAVYQMSSKLWHLRSDLNAWEDPALKAEAERLDDRLKNIGWMYRSRFPEKCYLVEFRGNPDYDSMDPGTDVDNYTVQDNMRKHLGTEGIAYDSELGWFVVDTTEGRADEVEAFLKKNHPYMRFSRTAKTDPEEIRPPMMTNWSSAKTWLNSRGLKIAYVLPKPTPKTGKELDDILKEARTVLARTGMPLKAAIKLL